MSSTVFPSNNELSSEDSEDQQRLLALFSNRIALKKSFKDVSAERRLLSERLDEAQEEVADLSRKLEYLESRLTDDSTAASTILFYHLRGLWRRLSFRLEDRAALLSRRIEGKKKVAAIESWQRRQKKRLKHVADKIESERALRKQTKRRLADNEASLQASRRFWWFLRRRKLRVQADDLLEELRARTDNLRALAEHHKTLRRSRPPVGIGLSVDDKRTINLNVVAMTQFLLRLFGNDDLLNRMENAIEREVGAIDYGDETVIEQQLSQAKRVEQALVSEEAGEHFDALIARQAEHLARLAQYTNSEKTLPDSFLGVDSEHTEHSDVHVISNAFEMPANVFSRQPWRLAEILLR
ncbi:MAG: hypothetical protein AB8F65_09940 [Woeseiaceae bacterium]